MGTCKEACGLRLRGDRYKAHPGMVVPEATPATAPSDAETFRGAGADVIALQAALHSTRTELDLLRASSSADIERLSLDHRAALERKDNELAQLRLHTQHIEAQLRAELDVAREETTRAHARLEKALGSAGDMAAPAEDRVRARERCAPRPRGR